MMPTFQRNKEDSSATSIKSSLPGPVDRYQAGSACGYWKRKNLRKFRKLRKKKKATPQQDKERKKLEDFKVIQANVAGIGTKKKEYEKLMHDNQVHLALLQETMHRNTNIHITGYTAYACKCNNCRGIITYVRNDVTCEVKDLSSASQPTDIHQITAWYGNNKLQFFNIYSPPGKPFNFPDTRVTFNKTILTGDFNGHSPLWGYEDTNDTGRRIEELCSSTNLILLQDENSPKTLLHKVHGTLHRPDLTLVSADLEHQTSEELLRDTSSDHRPILIKISILKRRKKNKKTRWNFKKANWTRYKEESEKQFEEISVEEMDVELLNNAFSTICLKASTLSIPRGFTPNFRPFWNEKLEKATKDRHNARLNYENNPTPENRRNYNKAVNDAKEISKESKRENWTQKCESLNLLHGGREAWTLLNNLSGENRRQNPAPIQTETETATSEFRKTEIFNKTFASVSKAAKKTTLDRGLEKVLQEKELKQTSDSTFLEPLTLTELTNSMKKLKKKKAPGPDKIHNEMLLNLGEKGKEVLLALYNKTWEHGHIPKPWKLATINPILKKGKSADLPGSYRPISLTSCVGKLAERMVNSRLYWWLESSGLINMNQAGFRAKSRTEDQLFRLTQRILDGFQKEEHTAAVFIDLQQAYDRVWRKGLFLKMQNLGIKGNLYNWIKAFLTDRLIQTRMNSSLSSKAVLEEGLPQGSSLSCTLFLIFINDLPEVLKSEIALFADDLVIWRTSSSNIINQRRLQEDLTNLETYCNFWKLKVNATKTVYTLFTRSHKESKKDLRLSINGSNLRKEDHPVYLGVTLDRQLNLNVHASNVKQKAMKRLNIIKKLASTSWGSNKDMLRNLYLGYCRSTLDYNIVLQNICSKSTRNSIDLVQNHAARFICGGMRSTPTAACEIHANIQPLEMRRQKAALEIFERSKRLEKNHPSRMLVDNWKPLNRLKQTSVLHKVKELQEKHYLPESRKSLDRVPKDLPPSLPLKQPTIKTRLLDGSNKQSNLATLRTSALETVNSYPKDWIHVYTDGSAFKATTNAGLGVLIQYPDGEKTELAKACGSFCSNNEAEKLAIHNTLTQINNTFETDTQTRTGIVIFTDSLSTLQKLENGMDASREIIDIKRNISSIITKHRIEVHLQWVPSHIGLKGNEAADQLAKRGAGLPQPENPVPYETACRIIKTNLQEEWLNNWATGTTARNVYSHMNGPRPKDDLNKLPRREQSTIFQLRTGHIPLNGYLNRIKPQHSPACPLCNEPVETVQHLLFECRKLIDLRACFLPKPYDLDNVLYGPMANLRQTFTYFTKASGRRAEAQRLLVH